MKWTNSFEFELKHNGHPHYRRKCAQGVLDGQIQFCHCTPPWKCNFWTKPARVMDGWTFARCNKSECMVSNHILVLKRVVLSSDVPLHWVGTDDEIDRSDGFQYDNCSVWKTNAVDFDYVRAQGSVFGSKWNKLSYSNELRIRTHAS